MNAGNLALCHRRIGATNAGDFAGGIHASHARTRGVVAIDDEGAVALAKFAAELNGQIDLRQQPKTAAQRIDLERNLLAGNRSPRPVHSRNANAFQSLRTKRLHYGVPVVLGRLENARNAGSRTAERARSLLEKRAASSNSDALAGDCAAAPQ